MKLAWLTPGQLVISILFGLLFAVYLTYTAVPQAVITPVQVITPVPTPPPVVIQPTYTLVYGGAGGSGGSPGYTIVVGAGGGSTAIVPVEEPVPESDPPSPIIQTIPLFLLFIAMFYIYRTFRVIGDL